MFNLVLETLRVFGLLRLRGRPEALEQNGIYGRQAGGSYWFRQGIIGYTDTSARR